MIIATTSSRNNDALAAAIPRINRRCGADLTMTHGVDCTLIHTELVGEGVLSELHELPFTVKIRPGFVMGMGTDGTMRASYRDDTEEKNLVHMIVLSNSVWGVKNKVWMPDVTEAVVRDMAHRLAPYADDVCIGRVRFRANPCHCVRFSIDQITFQIVVSEAAVWTYYGYSGIDFHLSSNFNKMPLWTPINRGQLTITQGPTGYVGARRRQVSLSARILFELTTSARSFKLQIAVTLALSRVYEWLRARRISLRSIAALHIDTLTPYTQIWDKSVTVADLVTIKCAVLQAPEEVCGILPGLVAYMKETVIDLDKLPFGPRRNKRHK